MKKINNFFRYSILLFLLLIITLQYSCFDYELPIPLPRGGGNFGDWTISLPDNYEKSYAPLLRVHTWHEIFSNGTDSTFAIGYIKFDSILVLNNYGFNYWHDQWQNVNYQKHLLTEPDTIDFRILQDSTFSFRVDFSNLEEGNWRACHVVQIICTDSLSQATVCRDGYYRPGWCSDFKVTN